MDYELNSNSWENDIDDPHDEFHVDVAGRGGVGGGALREATNRGSLYSNRNSHPLTEREVEQGLQNLEGNKGEGGERRRLACSCLVIHTCRSYMLYMCTCTCTSLYIQCRRSYIYDLSACYSNVYYVLQ